MESRTLKSSFGSPTPTSNRTVNPQSISTSSIKVRELSWIKGFSTTHKIGSEAGIPSPTSIHNFPLGPTRILVILDLLCSQSISRNCHWRLSNPTADPTECYISETSANFLTFFIHESCRIAPHKPLTWDQTPNLRFRATAHNETNINRHYMSAISHHHGPLTRSLILLFVLGLLLLS